MKAKGSRTATDVTIETTRDWSSKPFRDHGLQLKEFTIRDRNPEITMKKSKLDLKKVEVGTA